MKTKIIKLGVAVGTIWFALWLIFQITTYPYEVARWLQPAEARLVLLSAKQCTQGDIWLGMLVKHAVIHQGGYSAQAAFIDADRAKFHCELGYKDALWAVPITVDHRYRYASAGKLITAATIYDLARQKKLNLDDKLISYFPELESFNDERVKDISISQLLSHSAGFNRLTLNGDPMFPRKSRPWCPENIDKLQQLKLAFYPGQKQIYSNVGYCLLGEVIHRVSGSSYRDYVEIKYSLSKRNIKFVNNFYYEDEARYDFRYEEWYNDSYLKRFDFDAISAVAGLSGSATAFAELLWDIHNSETGFFLSQTNKKECYPLQRIIGCMSGGAFHYKPEKYGIALHFHEGYLPGVASIAIVDSFGGVTVMVKSGANRYQNEPGNMWIPWIYKRLSLHYTLQGKLPLLNSLSSH